jgi:caspase domain-containing protein/TENA/THI-4/PQQC family protein
VIEADKVNVHPVCDVLFGSEPKPLIEKQTRRKIMSFFERLKTEASAEWRAYTEHPFTNGLADGSLAEAAFRQYLVQDYLFLTEFARAYALSVYKSPKLAARMALVIGNSNYANLPKLLNPANDARAIADTLKSMGYKARLLIDGTEQNIRREIRQFASDSEKADVAFVFYAGHGAQINGNNYLLPIDIDIPRTEVDVQFSGLKVDDLVNSIRSNTKIVLAPNRNCRKRWANRQQ